uniref:Uncharacterized protein n=1 Tax=Anguilla anguilla TaxID=7936 RepID=A0A0E9VSG6_ANGAN
MVNLLLRCTIVRKKCLLLALWLILMVALEL